MKSAFLMHPLDSSYVRRSWYMGARLWWSVLPDKAIESLGAYSTIASNQGEDFCIGRDIDLNMVEKRG